MTRIAAVDIGSNSVLMSVGEPLSRGDFRILRETARTTRLGAGLDRTGRLSRAAIERTVEALAACRAEARALGVAIAKAAATAAVREARNPGDFLDRARRELGFGVEVASEDREARLTFLGVVGGSLAGPLAILDVGGTSTEVILGGGGRIERAVSLPIGAVRLKEAIPTEDTLRFFVRVIEVVPDDLDPADLRDRQVFATGGTATTLAAMRLRLFRYDPERVEGLPLARHEILDLVERVRRLPLEARVRTPGLPPSRADIIVSGGLLLAQLLEDLGVPAVTVSSRGLRHGLLRELAEGKL